MTIERTSGLLLHPTSLPGPFGSGDLDGAAGFLESLAEMRQSWWQVLPLGPTGYGNSPYQSPSTFAANPLLIGFEALVEDGLMTIGEYRGLTRLPAGRVNFDAVIPLRSSTLSTVTQAFADRASPELRSCLDGYLERHEAVWLDEFALFTAIKRANDLAPWWAWDHALAHRDTDALKRVKRRLRDHIRAVKIEQFLFDRQWTAVKSAAAERHIGLIGDIPIFVAHDSADVWGHRELFHLDEFGMPTVVAGVPPDYFSATGQRWGNPLYDWDQHIETGFTWWESRLRHMFDLVDFVRIDHFRGFAASWHIPATEDTAVNGSWVPAPGELLFDTLTDRFATMQVIAEDLGLITPDVEALRDRYGFPGMKVLQFGFGTESAHAIDQFRQNVVAYTGTHDNNTALGWFLGRAEENPAELAAAIDALGSTAETFAWDLITAVMHSVAQVSVTPVQDLLGLGTEARMNEPGTTEGNWTWRLERDCIPADIVDEMGRLTNESRRCLTR